jgi:hypothetical protein
MGSENDEIFSTCSKIAYPAINFGPVRLDFACHIASFPGRSQIPIFIQ